MNHNTESSPGNHLNFQGLMLVKFFNPQSKKHDERGNILPSLSAKFRQTVTIVQLDVTQNRELAADLDIFATPTYCLLKDGEMLFQFIGRPSSADLEAMLPKQNGGVTMLGME